MNIESLDNLSLEENKLIVINNINDGFNNYLNEVIDYSNCNFKVAFDKYFSILEKEFKSFGGFFIFDFYKENLSNNSLDIIKNNLEEEDYKIIEYIYNTAKEINHFYKSSDMNILRVLLKISLKELYFVTFYFEGITIWTNYNQKFVILKHKIED